MTWRKFCDFSYSKPDPEQLAALGFEGVLMYLSSTPGKGFDAALATRYHAAGLAIGALYETTADAALGGYTTGVAQAKAATALARQVGYPADCVIIYALDKDYTDTQMAGPVSDFVRGLHAVPGPDGEYGGYNQLGYLLKHQLGDAGALFQTYAWSSGRWLPVDQAPAEQFRNGQQIAGGTVDLCRVDSSLRLWEPPGSPGDQEVDMTTVDLTSAAIEAVREAVWNTIVGSASVSPASDPTKATALQAARDNYIRLNTVTNVQIPGLDKEVDALTAGEAAQAATLGQIQTALAGVPGAVVAALPQVAGGQPGFTAAQLTQIETAVAAVLGRTTAALTVAPPAPGASGE